MRTLKVTAVEAKKDKNGKDYNLITLQTPDHIVQNGVKIRVEPKEQRVVKYPESYLPNKEPQYGHDFKVGDFVAGDIVTRGDLLPYNIVDAQGTVTAQTTIATHVVLGNTDDAEAFEAAVQREFRSRGKFANDGSEASMTGYLKFWGFSPETGEMIAEPAAEEAQTEATL